MAQLVHRRLVRFQERQMYLSDSHWYASRQSELPTRRVIRHESQISRSSRCLQHDRPALYRFLANDQLPSRPPRRYGPGAQASLHCLSFWNIDDRRSRFVKKCCNKKQRTGQQKVRTWSRHREEQLDQRLCIGVALSTDKSESTDWYRTHSVSGAILTFSTENPRTRTKIESFDMNTAKACYCKMTELVQYHHGSNHYYHQNCVHCDFRAHRTDTLLSRLVCVRFKLNKEVLRFELL